MASGAVEGAKIYRGPIKKSEYEVEIAARTRVDVNLSYALPVVLPGYTTLLMGCDGNLNNAGAPSGCVLTYIQAQDEYGMPKVGIRSNASATTAVRNIGMGVTYINNKWVDDRR